MLKTAFPALQTTAVGDTGKGAIQGLTEVVGVPMARPLRGEPSERSDSYTRVPWTASGMPRLDESPAGKPFAPSGRTIWLAAALAVLLAATACTDAPVRLNGFSQAAAERQVELEDRLIGAPNALRLQDHHKALTQAPPTAGSEGNAQNADYFANELEEFGFDSIEVHRLNLIQPRIQTRELDFLGRAPQPLLPSGPLDTDESVLSLVAPYIDDGEVSAEVLFAHRGHPDDYEVLADRRVDVEGRIVLVRADSAFGPGVVEQAAKRGAVGMLVFADALPQGSRVPGKEANIYAAQAGAAPTARIPLLLIPGPTAQTILSALRGAAAPSGWRGVSTSDLRVGPAPSPIRMAVKYERATLPIVNVVGLLLGGELPDEWVMIGGYRDANGLGAWDAASSAAIRLESARIIARQVRRGFRPRRTIAVASWDASSHGGYGWTGWADRPRHSGPKVVAYLSQNGYAAGDFSAGGSTAFQPLINDIARRVKFPREDEAVYDRWRDTKVERAADTGGNRGPLVDHGGWTDVRLDVEAINSSVFRGRGVPSATFSFGSDLTVGPHNDDTHDAFKRDGDPKFDTGQQLAEFSALFLTRVANAEVPPLDFTATAETIDSGLEDVDAYADELGIRLRLRTVREVTRSFGLNAAALNAAIDEVLARPEEQRKESAQLITALTESLVASERDFGLVAVRAALDSGDRRQAQQLIDGLAAELAAVIGGIGEVLELAVVSSDSP